MKQEKEAEEETKGVPDVTDEVPEILVPSCVLIVGGGQSGKTTWATHIVAANVNNVENESKPQVVVMGSPMHLPKLQKEWEGVGDVEEMSGYRLKELLKEQQQRLDQRMENEKQEGRGLVLVIESSCTTTILDWMKAVHRTLMEFANNGRHLDTTLVIMAEHHKRVSPVARNQAEYVGITNVPHPEAGRELYRTYASSFLRSASVFDGLLDRAASNGLVWLDLIGDVDNEADRATVIRFPTTT